MTPDLPRIDAIDRQEQTLTQKGVLHLQGRFLHKADTSAARGGGKLENRGDDRLIVGLLLEEQYATAAQGAHETRRRSANQDGSERAPGDNQQCGNLCEIL